MTVSGEEAMVRDILAMWSTGVEGVKESFRHYGSRNLVWWNSARGALTGLDVCLQALDQMFDVLEIAAVAVPIHTLFTAPGRAVVERSDNLYRGDGTLIAEIPVTGVIGFDGAKMVVWRDYCDDWMTKLSLGQPVMPVPASAVL
ncbi:limonene-1,2-epoxide hydrolase family protein [Mycobacterium talmoniae]|uniref:Limonene-1,2-epoxide hydrolase n=1 Tax=Mycobacterium talmoniae TaxID=1858794 RepID=A0A1S1NR27_9MYCO|nr:limonene-1,2-epoxide hydrolase family protein [Mycobacterium talmoniae]OHV06895.1 limonene-1,2-epoxide hydrolase [Mycobacterium talmoniae]PQM47965.1 hypothetical protein C1Y40_01788 [Mycobacterium talmoniae]